jgi:glycerophosphoryl diester phosphodiesterase
LLQTQRNSTQQQHLKSLDTLEPNVKFVKTITGDTQNQKIHVVIQIVMENIHSLEMVSEKEKKLHLQRLGKGMNKALQLQGFLVSQLKDIQSLQDGEMMLNSLLQEYIVSNHIVSQENLNHQPIH